MILCGRCSKEHFQIYIRNHCSEQLPRITRCHNYQEWLFRMIIPRNHFQQFVRMFPKNSQELLGTIIQNDCLEWSFPGIILTCYFKQLSPGIIWNSYPDELFRMILVDNHYEWFSGMMFPESSSEELFRRDIWNDYSECLFGIMIPNNCS